MKRPLPSVSLVIRTLFALVAVSLSIVVAETPVVLGRSPLDKVVAVSSGHFAGASDDVIVVQDIGRMELSRGPGRDKTVVNLRRLALLRLGGSVFRSVWQSEPFNSTTATGSDIAGTCWTSGDVDADGLQELPCPAEVLEAADPAEIALDQFRQQPGITPAPRAERLVVLPRAAAPRRPCFGGRGAGTDRRRE